MKVITKQHWAELFPPGRSGGPAQVTDIWQVIYELDELGYFQRDDQVGNLRSDGSIEMDPGYLPTSAQKISTKKYVDDAISLIPLGQLVKDGDGYKINDYTFENPTGENSLNLGPIEIKSDGSHGWQGEGATGKGSVAFSGWVSPGYYTTSSGWVGTTASGRCSLALGGTNGYYSSGPTTASGDNSVSIGYGTVASGNNSQAFGYMSEASGSHSHAEGDFTRAPGRGAHSEGLNTYAFGDGAHAEGRSCRAFGEKAHAEGGYTFCATTINYTLTDVDYSNNTITLDRNPDTWMKAGEYIFCQVGEGIIQSTVIAEDADPDSPVIKVVYNLSAMAPGVPVYHGQTAVGGSGVGGSHSEGLSTAAFNNAAHAEGKYALCTGLASHAEGLSTIMHNDAGHAAGKYNVGTDKNTIHETGIGIDGDNRKNAFEIYLDGTLTAPEATPDLVEARGKQTLVPLSYLFSSEFGNALPTTDPAIAGQLWNDSGVMKISQG